MPPKKRAAPKSRKAETVPDEDIDIMARVTVRRPMKNIESGNLKDEEQEVLLHQENAHISNSNMHPVVIIENISEIDGAEVLKLKSEEIDKHVDSNKKSVLKKNVLTKVTKHESKKKPIEDVKVSKKTRKRAVSEDRQTSKDEEKAISSRSKKRQVDKDVSEPSDFHSNEPVKRNTRAASVDILSKNVSSVVSEPKRNRKVNKAPTIEPSEDISKKHRRSSSLDSHNMNTSPAVSKKNRKASKVVVETAEDKPKKKTKVPKKKDLKIMEKNKKEGKGKVIIDEKENVNLPPLEQNNIEEIEDEVKPAIFLTKESYNENIEVEGEKVPKQINSRGRAKRQVTQKLKSKLQQNKSSEESSGKTDTDSDTLKTPEVFKEENNLELEDDITENTPEQTSGKRHKRRPVTQKHVLKINKSEESSGKSYSDDSDLNKSQEIKPKRNGKQKESNVDQEPKLSKRQGRKVKTVNLKEEDFDTNEVETGESPNNIPDAPVLEEKLETPIVKRKTKARATKK